MNDYTSRDAAQGHAAAMKALTEVSVVYDLHGPPMFGSRANGTELRGHASDIRNDADSLNERACTRSTDPMHQARRDAALVETACSEIVRLREQNEELRKALNSCALLLDGCQLSEGTSRRLGEMARAALAKSEAKP